MNDPISLTEAAAILGYRGHAPERNVSSLIAQGKLSSMNVDGVLYVSRAEVEQWRQRRSKPAPPVLPVSSDPAPDDCITPAEAAAILGYTDSAGISKLISRGRLRAWPYVGEQTWYGHSNRTRMVSRTEVEALREQRRAEAERRRDAAERALKALSA